MNINHESFNRNPLTGYLSVIPDLASTGKSFPNSFPTFNFLKTTHMFNRAYTPNLNNLQSHWY